MIWITIAIYLAAGLSIVWLLGDMYTFKWWQRALTVIGWPFVTAFSFFTWSEPDYYVDEADVDDLELGDDEYLSSRPGFSDVYDELSEEEWDSILSDEEKQVMDVHTAEAIARKYREAGQRPDSPIE